MINKAVSSGDLLGYRYGRMGLSISRLFFTDDSLLFAKATNGNCMTIKSILSDYAIASGQVTNFGKSALCVSHSISQVEGIRLARLVGVNLVKCHE